MSIEVKSSQGVALILASFMLAIVLIGQASKCLNKTYSTIWMTQVAQSTGASSATFGNSDGTSSGSTGRAICTDATAPADGAITSISAKVMNASGNIGTAIYADNSGGPGALLAIDTSTSPAPTSAGWITNPVSYQIVSGTKYWLCVWSDQGTSYYFNSVAGQKTVLSAAQAASFETWPNPFISNTTTDGRAAAIYATYTPGATVITTPPPPSNPGSGGSGGTTNPPPATPPATDPPPPGNTVWYVEKGATGTGNGASWANAWNELDQINWSLIKPGHTLYIGGGSSGLTYTTSMNISAGGSPGNPITIKVSQESGHNGLVTIRGLIYLTNNWVTISGAKSDSVNGRLPVKDIRQITNNINLDISNSEGNNIQIASAGYVGIKILWVYSHDSGSAHLGQRLQAHGIYVQGGNPIQDLEIAYSRFQRNKTDGINFGGSSASGFGHFLVHHDIVEESGDDNIQFGSGTDISYSYVGRSHPTNFEGHPDSFQTLSPYVRIYNNEVVAKSNSWIYFEGMSPYDNKWFIYGNLCYNGEYVPQYGFSLGTQYFAGDPTTATWTNLVVANNTIVNTKGAGIQTTYTAPITQVTMTGTYIMNNIVQDAVISAGSDNGFAYSIAGTFSNTDMIFDYNVASGHNKRININGRSYTNANTLNTTEGYVGNSLNNPVFNNPGANDYSLSSSDTVARNRGGSLSTLIPGSVLAMMPDYNIDMNGNPRGGDGTWDIGALENTTGGSSIPSTVQTYTVTIAKSGSGTGTVTGTGVNCGTTCSVTNDAGTTLTLTATPGAGSTFSGWTGGGCTGTGSCNLTFNANITVTAAFTPTVIQDVTPPVISAITVPIVTTSGATINWTTNEAATGQVEYGLTTSYGSNSTLVTTLTTTHSVSLSSLTANTSYHFRLKSKDAAGNQAVTGDGSFTTSPILDTTAPVITVPGAQSSLGVGATSMTLAISTNETASCKWTKTAGTAYSTMANTFTASGLNFSTTITGLVSGVNTIYVRCQDTAGNANTSDTVVTITVASAPANRPPTANAGNDQTVTLPAGSTLSAAASSDPDGDTLTYSWVKIAGPSVTFSTPNAVSTGVTFTGGAGTYLFQVTVSDGKVTAQDDATITVNPVVVVIADADKDGVADASDKCPNTPTGQTVNNVGCPLPKVANFPTKSDLASVDLNTVSSYEVGNSFGKVYWNRPSQPLKLLRTYSQLDIDANLHITSRQVDLVSSALPELNQPATITFFNVNMSNPLIQKDGQLCTTCTLVSNQNSTVVFNVQGFSVYTVVAGPVIPNADNTVTVTPVTPAAPPTVVIPTTYNPPVPYNSRPNTTLPAGTTQTTLSLSTDLNATCKYSISPGTTYSSIANTFSTTGNTNHSSTISGLRNGYTYVYYVRCLSNQNVAMTTDYVISFAVGGTNTTPGYVPPRVPVTRPVTRPTTPVNGTNNSVVAQIPAQYPAYTPTDYSTSTEFVILPTENSSIWSDFGEFLYYIARRISNGFKKVVGEVKYIVTEIRN